LAELQACSPGALGTSWIAARIPTTLHWHTCKLTPQLSIKHDRTIGCFHKLSLSGLQGSQRLTLRVQNVSLCRQCFRGAVGPQPPSGSKTSCKRNNHGNRGQ
jgi:hypothetical protein